MNASYRIYTSIIFIISCMLYFYSITYAQETSVTQAIGTPAKNIILFIGDGMGQEHIKAGSYFIYGEGQKLPFQAFPYQSMMTTGTLNGGLTDSAAGATAIATGQKTSNLHISLTTSGQELPNLLELHKQAGKKTGLITTSYLTDATIAVFGAHTNNRYDSHGIRDDYFTQTRPNVLFGAAQAEITENIAIEHGYTAITTKEELFAQPITDHLIGMFGWNIIFPPGFLPQLK